MRGRKCSETVRLLFAVGKIQGTSCMRNHILVHRVSTKYFSNSFVFKPTFEKEELPGDITPALGAPNSTPTIPFLASNY